MFTEFYLARRLRCHWKDKHSSLNVNINTEKVRSSPSAHDVSCLQVSEVTFTVQAVYSSPTRHNCAGECLLKLSIQEPGVNVTYRQDLKGPVWDTRDSLRHSLLHQKSVGSLWKNNIPVQLKERCSALFNRFRYSGQVLTRSVLAALDTCVTPQPKQKHSKLDPLP